MRELSMHVLDIAQNCISAGASVVDIEVSADTVADTLSIVITDNGCGMSEDFVARVIDPFTTTRTTRRVGLGIPMFAEAARACGGDLTVESALGTGTMVKAIFTLSHIDRVPIGDMAATMVSLVACNPEMDFRYSRKVDGEEFLLDTRDMREQLGDVALDDPGVLSWMGEYIRSKSVRPEID